MSQCFGFACLLLTNADIWKMFAIISWRKNPLIFIHSKLCSETLSKTFPLFTPWLQLKQTNKLVKWEQRGFKICKKVSSKSVLLLPSCGHSWYCSLSLHETWKLWRTILITFFTTGYRMRLLLIFFFLGMPLSFNFILICCEYCFFHLGKQYIHLSKQIYFTKYSVHFRTYGYKVNIIICTFWKNWISCKHSVKLLGVKMNVRISLLELHTCENVNVSFPYSLTRTFPGHSNWIEKESNCHQSSQLHAQSLRMWQKGINPCWETKRRIGKRGYFTDNKWMWR